MNFESNTLANETSPYLLQHADNPVFWHPWSEATLEYARCENKPILLSIGYSACHWCHVMAHESFEDQATADVMNAHYVNIKVDREERPDLDKIYQRAQQLLSQRHGGWPLTMILMPEDQIPFFGGTYFPKTEKHGLPAFKDLLTRVSDYYVNQREQLEEQNQSLGSALQSVQANVEQSNEVLDQRLLDMARKELEQSTDKANGGFGQAPKFPHPTNFERLIRHWSITAKEDVKALELACLSLNAMARGGVYDQIGGGFCRYSVDNYWMIPHFEKMLYDNGALLGVYSHAWLATQNPLYKRTVHSLVNWLLNEMKSPEGNFYSSIDADSEGVEGKYYVWQADEIKNILSEEEYLIINKHYGFDQEPNFEGAWNPHIYIDREELATQFNIDGENISNLIEQARIKLYQIREKRVRPGTDDKILTSWNALMIKGLAIASRSFDKPEWLLAAQNAFDAIRNQLWKNNRLLATYKDGKAHLNAYLDDYVFLIDAGLELLQSQWRTQDLNWIIKLADVCLEQFEDKELGGFFFTSNDHEKLIDRPKPLADEATPAGNGIAAYTLNRLGHLLGDTKYLDACEKTLKLAQPQITEYPSAYNSLLSALEETLIPLQVIVIRGQAKDIQNWQNEVFKTIKFNRLVFAIPNDENELPGALKERKILDNKTTAYVCNGKVCSKPINNIEILISET